jgi:D-aminopeptidase
VERPPGPAASRRWCVLNGNGELTGSHWVNESGLLESPILLTNTDSVGVVRDAVIAWGNRRFPPSSSLDEAFALPVVAETSDAFLNDIMGQHVKPEHVFRALDDARPGPVREGNVGGGTGMMTSEWKGGIGTSSRVVQLRSGKYVVGVLVQANYGRRGDLRIAGVPVGQEIPERMPEFPPPEQKRRDGSLIVVVGTSAPLLPHQMTRLVRRVAVGLGRLGAVSYNSSGDLFIGFGTAEPTVGATGLQHWPASATRASIHCSRRRSAPPKRRSSTHWSPPRRWSGPTASPSTPCLTIACARSCASTVASPAESGSGSGATLPICGVLR